MNPDTLVRFVRFFSLADATSTERLTQRLALVLHEPAAYETTYADELLERGIGPGLPRQELRDVALIDALLSEELLWEIDWKESAEAAAECLQEVLTQQQRPGELALPGHRARGPETLDAVQDALEPLGLALVLFALDSDSYPLSVVADAQAEELRQLATELGFTLVVY